MNGDRSNYLIGTIDVIKFVGRHHAFLTGIMDQLNVCYSVQVGGSSGQMTVAILM